MKLKGTIPNFETTNGPKRKISLNWYIKEKAKAYSPVEKRCLLCLRENFHISFSKERLLNKAKQSHFEI